MPVKASDIKSYLAKAYPQPEYATFFEVADGTGYSGGRRYADAIVMSLWPSRGLTLDGYEIKVSRTDWMKERADPTKAERIAAYCDTWTLITGPNVVKEDVEIPPAWGWLEFDGTRAQQRKHAQKTEAAPIDRSFLAALLRRADQANKTLVDAAVAAGMAAAEAELEERIKKEIEWRGHRNTQALDMIEKFETAAGIKIGDWRNQGEDPTEVGRAIRAFLRSGLAGLYMGPFAAADTLRQHAENIDRWMKDAGYERPQEMKKGKRYG